ncbi:hypothetical protein NMY22_g4541 [Coprinellus aureogranulatus]|nr:hypothetical protein NMY22_g4541 [Coprinellus aureogranulatus]
MAFDFVTYLETQNIAPKAPGNTLSRNFDVKLLTGGFTNVTARVTFTQPISLFGSSSTHSSAILKHAPPHLANDPSQSMSITRQVVEARALELMNGQEIRQGGRWAGLPHRHLEGGFGQIPSHAGTKHYSP